MKRYQVAISQTAAAKICAAFEYIRADSPANAERWHARVRHAIEGLDVMPHRCPTAPEARALLLDIRMLVVGDYLCVFVIDDEAACVTVADFRHGAQRTPKL
jgi:plasmid stabilization system protein ParE